MKSINKKFWILPIVAGGLFLVSFVLSDNETSTSETEIDTPKKAAVKSETETLQWHTDLNEVHQISTETGKPIFAFFTGSDWCGWCRKLQAEVFAKEAFVEWANDNVVLLELDFPRRKVLDSTLQAQNYGLQRAFGVSGYPTIWIFETEFDQDANNMSISALGSLGYPRGAEVGKEEDLFIKNANQILANKPD